jgi:hypothetical protein
MCKTTSRKNSANPATKNPTGPKPAPLPPIKTLQQYLTAAYNGEKANLEPSSMVISGFTLKSKNASMSIIMLDQDGNHDYAEINGTITDASGTRKVMDYSGSLAKVGALYAAFDLRAAARKFVTDNGTANFFTDFLSAIDTSAAVASLRSFGQGLKPVVTTIFDVSSGQAEFQSSGSTANKKFKEFLDDILENPSAGQVIRALGYSYINVSLMKGGFYDAATQKGIWLAGDYSAEKKTKSVRIPVENDTVPNGSGQAITTEQMSRMFRLLHMGQAYPHVADAAERTAANDGAHAVLMTQESFFFLTGPPSDRLMHLTVPVRFTNHCAKVGIGSLGKLKPDGTTDGPPVYSEGSVMQWDTPAQVTKFNTDNTRKHSGDFVLVWQNMYDKDSRWDALVRIINTTIENFLKQT